MGLFSFIGKAAKAVGGVVGGALKVGGALGLIPGPAGALAGRLGGLLAHKSPMSTTPVKVAQVARIGVQLLRGQAPVRSASPIATYKGKVPAPLLRASPVMPGGAVATSRGIAAKGSAAPPMTYGGAVVGAIGKKRRKRKKGTSARRRSSSRGRKRRLKFGSPAWRKKYMHKRRKRRAA